MLVARSELSASNAEAALASSSPAFASASFASARNGSASSSSIFSCTRAASPASKLDAVSVILALPSPELVFQIFTRSSTKNTRTCCTWPPPASPLRRCSLPCPARVSRDDPRRQAVHVGACSALDAHIAIANIVYSFVVHDHSGIRVHHCKRIAAVAVQPLLAWLFSTVCLSLVAKVLHSLVVELQLAWPFALSSGSFLHLKVQVLQQADHLR